MDHKESEAMDYLNNLNTDHEHEEDLLNEADERKFEEQRDEEQRDDK